MPQRRAVLAAALGTAAVSSCPAFAQAPARRARVALLVTGASHPLAAALPREMAALGYREGATVAYDVRFGEGRSDRLAELAADLVRLAPDVIVTAQTPAGRAARDATKTIPIVLGGAGAPLETGLVANLSRPGGNITGVTDLSAELGGRRLQVLKDIIPSLMRVGALASSHDLFTKPFLGYMQEGAATNGIVVQPVEIAGPAEFEGAFASFVEARAQAVVVQGIFNPARAALLALAARHRLPLVSWDEEMTQGGGLFSLASNRTDSVRRTAALIDRILKGARPGDLPVEQPTSFELVVNLRTARALGLTVPQSILVAATEVIE